MSRIRPVQLPREFYRARRFPSGNVCEVPPWEDAVTYVVDERARLGVRLSTGAVRWFGGALREELQDAAGDGPSGIFAALERYVADHHEMARGLAAASRPARQTGTDG